MFYYRLFLALFWLILLVLFFDFGGCFGQFLWHSSGVALKVFLCVLDDFETIFGVCRPWNYLDVFSLRRTSISGSACL